MSTAVRRKKDLEERKQLILDKSRDLFFEHGYDHVTIQDICKAIEYGRSAIYNIFKSNEEIYAHIKMEGLLILQDLLEKSANPELGFDEQMQNFRRALVDFADQNFAYYRAMFLQSESPHDRIPEEFQQKMDTQVDLLSRPILDLFEKGIARGELRQEPVQGTFFVFWSSMVGIINAVLVHERTSAEVRRDMIEERTSLFVRSFLNGIRQS